MSELNAASTSSFIDGLVSSGRHHFTIEQLKFKLELSDAAAKSSLGRLARKGLVASPARGFYVVVPPEYRSLGCLPAEQFIPALMEYQGIVYYTGLLSAAQYYGAAHHRPQEFQVVVEKNRRLIKCGMVRVSFFANKRISQVSTRSINTPRGALKISTPEATAMDLVGYYDRVGGLDQVATLLSELSEHIDSELLKKAAEVVPISWAQRLGYLLEQSEGTRKAHLLKDFVAETARDYTPLLPGVRHGQSKRSKKWKLIINAQVEVEF